MSSLYTCQVVLHMCAETDPLAVWKNLSRLLDGSVKALIFTTGLPRWLVDRVPVAEVLEWIALDPESRATVAARLVDKNLTTDESHASQIIARFGESQSVQVRILFGLCLRLVDGFVLKPLGRSCNVDGTGCPANAVLRLRDWAVKAASDFRQMAERDRLREAEDDLRGR